MKVDVYLQKKSFNLSITQTAKQDKNKYNFTQYNAILLKNCKCDFESGKNNLSDFPYGWIRFLECINSVNAC